MEHSYIIQLYCFIITCYFKHINYNRYMHLPKDEAKKRTFITDTGNLFCKD